MFNHFLDNIFPPNPYKFDGMLKDALQMVTAGRFSDALVSFKDIMSVILMSVVDKSGGGFKQRQTELLEALDLCKEYVIGLKCELERRKITGASPRVTELALYFTHCRLHPQHLVLALRSAMNVAVKAKNMAAAKVMASKLLELGPGPQISQAVCCICH